MADIPNITGKFWLSYADIPFCLDDGMQPHFREDFPTNLGRSRELPFEKFQQETNLIDQINRIIDTHYLNDFGVPPDFLGRDIEAIARRAFTTQPSPNIHIGDWYYPNTASRWSVFRGLATSEQVKYMLKATDGYKAQNFIMRSVPSVLGFDGNWADPVVQQAREDEDFHPLLLDPKSYTIISPMYMLPPRPLAEHGDSFNGLYLVTLVDERYYWQWASVSLKIERESTWNSVINQIAFALGITIDLIDIPAVYTTPEPDSQFWTSESSAAHLLDAVAYNIGDVVVRWFNGSYKFLHPLESQTVAKDNRGKADKIIRTAGGEFFTSGATNFLTGPTTLTRNSVIPETVNVVYPQYILGDDAPHFANKRYRPPRPSCWYEESYGGVYKVSVPISSGNSVFVTNPFLRDLYPNSGLVGIGQSHDIHSTAKALYSGEIQLNANPINNSGLVSLAMQLAADYWNWQVAEGLDEVYPGTFAWTPEGFHDIIWTYSARKRQATTRVMRTQWNQMISEMQHSTPPPSGSALYVNSGLTFSGRPAGPYFPPGVGGPSVAQSWRDSFSGEIKTTLAQTMLSGDFVAVLTSLNYLPTDQRWRGIINSGQPDREIVLFEATSGMSGGVVSVVYRGIDGTVQQQHDAGVVVSQLLPNTAYGINLVNQGLMQWMFPSQWTSGGIQGVNIVPQTQSVLILSASGHIFNNKPHFSGRVQSYDTTQAAFVHEPLCWIVERNSRAVVDGRRYDGQFAGYSANVSSGFVLSGFVPGLGIAPVYLIDVGDGGGGGVNFGSGCFRFLDDVAVVVTCISGEITTTVTKTYRYYYIQSGQSSNVPCESGG